jgi:hypothetical protein
MANVATVVEMILARMELFPEDYHTHGGEFVLERSGKCLAKVKQEYWPDWMESLHSERIACKLLDLSIWFGFDQAYGFLITALNNCGGYFNAVGDDEHLRLLDSCNRLADSLVVQQMAIEVYTEMEAKTGRRSNRALWVP